jgi:hypothetical protein
MKVSGQLHALAALPRENNLQYPLDRRLGEPQSRSRRCREKIILTARNRTPTVEPVSRHTDWDIPPVNIYLDQCSLAYCSCTD